ncbi:MAG: glycoside hydrolase family 3 protein [Chitinophagales bacterium]|nr:glycoside hydrolase family 3 protein [Hyphomicrobiales bacterium]
MQKSSFSFGIIIFATIAGAFSALSDPSVIAPLAKPAAKSLQTPLIVLAAEKKSVAQTEPVERPEQDGWHSSRGLYNEWPQLGEDDCARYGARYGYSECGRAPAPRKIPEKKALPESISGPKVEVAKPQINAVKAKISTGKVANPQVRPEQRLLSIKVPKSMPPLPERRLSTVNVAVPQAKDIGMSKAQEIVSGGDVSRMLIMSFDGVSESSDEVKNARRKLEQNVAAHIILAARNMNDREQTKALIAYFKQGRPQRDGLVSTEFTGGELAKSGGFKSYPTPFDIGQGNEPQTAHALYKGMAIELAELGININFSPILGLHSEKNSGPNSFGADPLHAASFASAYIHGHMDAGVITSLSHFAISETHPAPADLQASSTVYREIFKKDLGDAVTVDGENFAVTIKTLRDDLGFRGVIVADFQNFDITGENGSRFEKVIVEAINAGADLLLVKSSTALNNDQVTLAAQALRAASQSGAIDRDRLNGSLANVEKLRKKAEARLAVREKRDSSFTRIDVEGETVKSN